MIFIILFIFSFKVNNLNPLPALPDLFPLILLSNLFIACEVIFFNNPGKLSLAKGIATFIWAFLPKLPNQEPRDPQVELFYIFKFY